MQSRVQIQVKPSRGEAARAVDVQLKAVAGDVPDSLKWERAKHCANRNAATPRESLSQQ